MRISRKMDGLRNCQIRNSVDRARDIYGTTCIDSCITATVYKQETPRESDILPTKVSCLNFQGTTVGLESTRIQAKIQKVLEDSIDPLNPDARFSEYRGPYLAPVCPPVPTEILNAYLPKASTRCPLPNKPSFPASIV
jgi:hypothetical protein